MKEKKLKLILEPGKSICANAGVLLTRVLYVKEGGTKKFIIVDAAMNDLIRPCLYDAFHFIWPTKVANELVPVGRGKDLKLPGLEKVDVVGPICEGADFLAKERDLPAVARRDLLAVYTAGAYGFTMSSNYNSRRRAPEVPRPDCTRNLAGPAEDTDSQPALAAQRSENRSEMSLDKARVDSVLEIQVVGKDVETDRNGGLDRFDHKLAQRPSHGSNGIGTARTMNHEFADH